MFLLWSSEVGVDARRGRASLGRRSHPASAMLAARSHKSKIGVNSAPKACVGENKTRLPAVLQSTIRKGAEKLCWTEIQTG
jgi:hypothetical protein